MKIGDKTLTVRRATQAGQAKPDNPEALVQAQQQIAQLQAVLGPGGIPGAAGAVPGVMPGAVPGGIGIPGMPGLVPGVMPDPLATPILGLTNCFDIEELNDPEAFEEIKEDMEEECGKYGKVESLLIPKPTDENASGVGKVIIKYASAAEAAKAKAAMHGRRFGGKTVQALYISESDYSEGKLD